MYSQLSQFSQSYNFSTKDKALPFIASLVKRAAEKEFQDRFSQIRDSPLVQELPIKDGNSLAKMFSVFKCSRSSF